MRRLSAGIRAVSIWPERRYNLAINLELRNKLPYQSFMLYVSENISIDEWELSEQFIQAQGPGGQNVNKVETAVQLRFEAERSPNLPDQVKLRLRRLAGRRWTADGAVLISSQETRSQSRNRSIARARLVELIRRALETPKRRIATRPTLASKKRRLKAKTVRGQVKSLRGKVGPEE